MGEKTWERERKEEISMTKKRQDTDFLCWYQKTTSLLPRKAYSVNVISSCIVKRNPDITVMLLKGVSVAATSTDFHTEFLHTNMLYVKVHKLSLTNDYLSAQTHICLFTFSTKTCNNTTSELTMDC